MTPKQHIHAECFFDGACWPNPNGHAASGAYIRIENVTVFAASRYLGCEDTSNNCAEYDGLNLILEKLIEIQPDSATIYGDSDLVIRQMKGKWKAGTLTKKERNGRAPIKPRLYLPYYHRAVELRSRINGQVDFIWISRDLNFEADALSRIPLEDREIVNPYEKMFASRV